MHKPETNWKVTTAPDLEPVSLAEAKLHMAIDIDAADTLIAWQITAARQYCEEYERRSYITQTITAKLQGFSNEIILPRPVLQAVSSIKYIDTGGDEQLLASSVYDVDVYREPGRVTLAHNQSWPALRGDVNGVEIIYTAGYGDAAADVPALTKAAILLFVGYLYENREAASVSSLAEIPIPVRNLLNKRTWM